MKGQIGNMKYTRRFKAEVGNGIGSFMDCLEILVKISVMSNCAMLFWTSKYFKALFVSVRSPGAKIDGFEHVSPITSKYTMTDFLKLVIYVEHIIILFQIFLRQIVSDVTPEIIRGERDRNTLLKNHLEKTSKGHLPNIMHINMSL